MSQRKQYHKPFMVAVTLKTDRPVADPCWSPNSDQHKFGGWYNTPGFGGLNFLMSGGGNNNCSAGSTTFSVNYYIDNSGATISEAEFYEHHSELNPDDIEDDCRQYVQGNWPGFKSKDTSHLDPDPPVWPWSR